MNTIALASTAPAMASRLRKKSIDTLVENALARVASFARSIDMRISDPRYKTVAVYEYLLLIIHHADRLASSKKVDWNTRLALRREIALGLVDRDFLPVTVAGRMIDESVNPGLDTTGLSRLAAIEVLLPRFMADADERDRYYSSCTAVVGENQWDDSSLLNRLSSRIADRLGSTGHVTKDAFTLAAAVDSILNRKLAKSDMKALGNLV